MVLEILRKKSESKGLLSSSNEKKERLKLVEKYVADGFDIESMLISILNMFNTDVSKTIDQIYNKFQAKCNLMNIKSDILEEQVNELNAFIKEKGLEKEYQMRKK